MRVRSQEVPTQGVSLLVCFLAFPFEKTTHSFKGFWVTMLCCCSINQAISAAAGMAGAAHDRVGARLSGAIQEFCHRTEGHEGVRREK